MFNAKTDIHAVSVNDEPLYSLQLLITQLYTMTSRTDGWLLHCSWKYP